MAKQTKTDELLPVYLVVGEDELKRAAVLKRLRARLETMGDLSFDSDDLDGETVTGSDIVVSCNTMPFASPLRLVVVHGAENLKKADADELAAYVSAPNPTTVLALEAEKLAKNTRLYKAVAAVGAKAVIDCAPAKRVELPKNVRAMAVTHGVTFTDGAARKLVELVGENTVRLDSEIRKIALAHGQRSSDAVSEQEVISLVARTVEVKPWEFVDAFAARDLKKCMLYLSRMPSASPLALIAMCVSRLRELMCAKALAARGVMGTAALSEALAAAGGRKMQDWQLKNHAAWARGFSAEELRRALSRARDAERAMKSGADPRAAFIDWLLEVLPRR